MLVCAGSTGLTAALLVLYKLLFHNCQLSSIYFVLFALLNILLRFGLLFVPVSVSFFSLLELLSSKCLQQLLVFILTIGNFLNHVSLQCLVLSLMHHVSQYTLLFTMRFRDGCNQNYATIHKTNLAACDSTFSIDLS